MSNKCYILILASSSLKLFISKVQLAQFGYDDGLQGPNRLRIVTNFKEPSIVSSRSGSAAIPAW